MNRQFIQNQKELKRQIDSLTPQIYSVMALALHRKFGWGYERINRAFVESQNIWTQASEEGIDVVLQTYNETGILTVSVQQARRHGIEIPEEIQQAYDNMYTSPASK